MSNSSATDENDISEKDSNEADASVCYNCQSTNAPVWRRDPGGQPLCNTCDLHYVSFFDVQVLFWGNHSSDFPRPQKHRAVSQPQSLTTEVIRNRYVPTTRSKSALPDAGTGSHLWYTPHSSTTQERLPSSETIPTTIPRASVVEPPPPVGHPGDHHSRDNGIVDRERDRNMGRGRESPGHRSSESVSVRERDLGDTERNKTGGMEGSGTVLAPQSPTIRPFNASRPCFLPVVF